MGHKGGGTSKGKRGGASGGAVRSGPTAAAKPKGASPAPGWHTPVRYATVTLLCIIAAALVTPFDLLLPQLTVPVLLGLMAALWARKPIAAGVIAAVSALAGCTVLLSVYRAESFIAWIQTRMPAYAVQDTTRDVFEFILGVTGANPVLASAGSAQGIAVMFVMVALAGGIAAVAAWWIATPMGKARTAWAAWGVALLLGVSFAYTAWTSTAPFRQRISTEPADLSYSYDAVFNLKTYYLMRGGTPFYDAYITAMSKDSRVVGEAKFKDGKLVIGTPAMLRGPAAFFLMRIAGAGGSDGIVLLSILSCAGVLVGAYPALRTTMGTRALFAAAMLYPGLMLHTVWYNILFPDWWAALALLGSVLFLVRRRYWEAGALAVLATVFREIAGFWLLALIVAALISAKRERREGLVRAGVYAGGMLVSVGLFAWHYVSASPYFAAQAAKPFGVSDLLGANMSLGLDRKLMSATSYLMMPYGLYAVPTVALMPAGAAGFFLALPKGSTERWALTIYPLLMLAYYLTFGATSSYWGQLVMPVAVLGTGVLLARADLIVTRLSSRTAPPPIE